MRSQNILTGLLVPLAAICVCVSNIFASGEPEKPAEKLDFLTSKASRPIADNSQRRSKIKEPAPRRAIANTWKPYFLANRNFEPITNYFFDLNAGCGFLYFAGLRADLQRNEVRPGGGVSDRRDNGEMQGRLNYNRTPVFEGTLGMSLLEWLSLGLSYVHQGGVNISTNYQYYGVLYSNQQVAVHNFSSVVSFDAILAKVYFSFPISMIWKTISYNLYLGAGVGPGWQSWTQNIYQLSVLTNQGFAVTSFPLRLKFSANAVWEIDAGFKLKSVIPKIPFLVRVGTKFIGWGQARQIGKPGYNEGFYPSLFPQSLNAAGFLRPFKIKFVYSFAPYMGVEWYF